MDFNLEEGISATFEEKVTERNTAKSIGSGGVDVYATPMMIALMEKAAFELVDGFLPTGYTTVGTSLQINHIAATPLGIKVSASAVLTNIDGKKLTFSIEAFDEKEKIGEGTHERYIVNTERFIDKAKAKC